MKTFGLDVDIPMDLANDLNDAAPCSSTYQPSPGVSNSGEVGDTPAPPVVPEGAPAPSPIPTRATLGFPGLTEPLPGVSNEVGDTILLGDTLSPIPARVMPAAPAPARVFF